MQSGAEGRLAKLAGKTCPSSLGPSLHSTFRHSTLEFGLTSFLVAMWQTRRTSSLPLKCSLLRLSGRLLYLHRQIPATYQQLKFVDSAVSIAPKCLPPTKLHQNCLHSFPYTDHLEQFDSFPWWENSARGASISTGPILAIVFFATGAANLCLSQREW